MTTTTIQSTVQAPLEPKVAEKVKPKNTAMWKTALIITAIVLASLAALAGLITLTVLYPHVMVPILICTIGLPLIPLALFGIAFAKFGH